MRPLARRHFDLEFGTSELLHLKPVYMLQPRNLSFAGIGRYRQPRRAQIDGRGQLHLKIEPAQRSNRCNSGREIIVLRVAHRVLQPAIQLPGKFDVSERPAVATSNPAFDPYFFTGPVYRAIVDHMPEQ